MADTNGHQLTTTAHNVQNAQAWLVLHCITGSDDWTLDTTEKKVAFAGFSLSYVYVFSNAIKLLFQNTVTA